MLSGLRALSKFTVRETKHSGNKQIRICVLNTTSDEETAAGNQLCTPELLQALEQITTAKIKAEGGTMSLDPTMRQDLSALMFFSQN